MAESSLRDALEQELKNLPVMSYDDGYRVQALPKATLLDLLARHPAEPVGVSDEAVGAAIAAVNARWSGGITAAPLTRGDVRAALEAAQPFMQPQVVASRERLVEVLSQGGRTPHLATQQADALLAAGVFREPPTREQIRAALSACTCARTPRPTCPLHGDLIAAVLALMGGAEEETK